MAARIHLPWHGITGARGELAHDVARLVQQQTMATLCRRRAKLAHVSPHPSEVDCADCRAALAQRLREARAQRIEPRGARIASELATVMNRHYAATQRFAESFGARMSIRAFSVRYVPAKGLIRVDFDAEGSAFSALVPSCHLDCALSQVGVAMIAAKRLPPGEYDIVEER